MMQEQTVALPSGVRLHCRIENPRSTRPVLILLNGASFHLHQWDRLVAKGAWTDHFRVLRYDYADTGRSSRRASQVCIDSLVEELVALLDALDISEAHFFGVSQGTIVLQGLAGAAPERILSASGYGWYHGDYSNLRETVARIEARVSSLAALSAREFWNQPLDRAAFDELWSEVYRGVMLGDCWENLSFAARMKDRVLRRVLFPLLAPTPIRSMYDWFSYCVHGLRDAQPRLRRGHAALADKPVLIQHAVEDETLEIGMARELAAAIPGARIIEYGDGYGHASIAFKSAQARSVVADHVRFLVGQGRVPSRRRVRRSRVTERSPDAHR